MLLVSAETKREPEPKSHKERPQRIVNERKMFQSSLNNKLRQIRKPYLEDSISVLYKETLSEKNKQKGSSD